MLKGVREKCGKLCISSILSSKRGITPTKIDANWRHLNLLCSTVKQSHMQNFSSICQSMEEKMRKTVYFEYSKFRKRYNSNKNWSKMTTLKLALWYIKTKSYTKFELNMSKHVGEKCGKLHICKSLKLKRSITPAKSDGNWWHLNLILRA